MFLHHKLLFDIILKAKIDSIIRASCQCKNGFFHLKPEGQAHRGYLSQHGYVFFDDPYVQAAFTLARGLHGVSPPPPNRSLHAALVQSISQLGIKKCGSCIQRYFSWISDRIFFISFCFDLQVDVDILIKYRFQKHSFNISFEKIYT